MSAHRVHRCARPIVAVLLGCGLVGAVTPAEAEYWALVETSASGPIDGKCVPGEARPQGILWKIFAAGPTSLEVGAYAAWEKTPYWTHHRAVLPPLPARLDPGQKIQWPLAIEVSAGNPKIETGAWIYRKSGAGGEEDRLAGFNAGTSKTVTSKLHTVPNGPAPPESRLTYETGGGWTGGFTCNFRYLYQWSDKPAPKTPVSTPTLQPDPLTPSGGPTTEQNTDRIGSDYKHMIAAGSAAECKRFCAAESSCVAYTWVKPGIQGPYTVCYLKNAIPPATPSNCCTSGRK